MNFDISGAKIFLKIPTGIPFLGDFLLSETLVVSWIVMAIITGLCIFLTRNLRVENISKRQAIAELIVESANNLVRSNTGGTKFDKMIPFVAALFGTSIVSNLISLTGSNIGILSFYGQGAGKYPTGTSVIQDVLDVESGWSFSAKNKVCDISIDNSLESHRYYVRENGSCKITEAMSVAEAHKLAAESSDEHFFMAGIRE